MPRKELPKILTARWKWCPDCEANVIPIVTEDKKAFCLWHRREVCITHRRERKTGPYKFHSGITIRRPDRVQISLAV